MVIDKSWTLLERHDKAFYTVLMKFVDDCKPLVNSAGNIKCPCKSCRTVLWVSIENLPKHITRYGWDPSYKSWVHHGEPDLPPPPPVIDNIRQPQMSDMVAFLNDLSYIPPNIKQNEPAQGDIGETSNEPTQAKRNEFEKLYASVNQEMCPGCDYVTRLDFMAKFTYFNAKGKLTDSIFNEMLEFFQHVFPTTKGYKLPPSYYAIKKTFKTIELGYESIHACVNDCFLFRGDNNKDVHFCPVCKTSRWKDSNRPGKKVPKKPGKMQHPVDGRAWKNFDTKYLNFAKEPRNVRLGLAADGFNPFGNLSQAYCMWPVLWALKGVETIDVATGQKFNMRAMVLWTTNDFPARSSLSGWSGQGYKACLTCNEDTPYVRVLEKTSYVGHRRFLKKPHKWRRSLNSMQYLPDEVAKPIIELCSFFKKIYLATLMKDDMLKAQSKVVDILCNLEFIYSPAFFDIMIYLVIHLHLEALEGGPIRPRWMFPFERFMKKLKGYVRNKAKPEDNEQGVSAISELFALACVPTPTLISVNSCIVNGVRFVVHSRDERRTTKNNDICLPGGKEGEINEGRKVKHLVLINNMAQIMTKGEAFKDDQYILVTQVKQCFYLEDMARRQPHWKVVEHVNHKKFSNGGVIVVEEDPDVIHFDNSFDLSLSTILNDLDNATLHIDGQSTKVDAQPNIIDLEEDCDIIYDEDTLPGDLADFDDEDLVNVDDDDGVDMLHEATAVMIVPLHTIYQPVARVASLTEAKAPENPIWGKESGHAAYLPGDPKPRVKEGPSGAEGGDRDKDWDAEIAFWNDPKNQARAAQNRQNWAKSVAICRQGSQSLARLRDQMMESSATREYLSLIHTFFMTHTVGGVFTRDDDRAIYEEMLRLQGLGSNTPSGVPYTEEEINAMAQKGKQRGHLPSVGEVLPGRAIDVPGPPSPQCTHNSVDVKKLKKKSSHLTKQVYLVMKLFRSEDKFSQMHNQYESSHEFGNASRSGGCADDEMADDEDGGEDEEDEEVGDS
nr:hypothetical protein [Tanacetum cinerariifolium]